MQEVLRLPRGLTARVRMPSPFVPVALLPMGVILVLVCVLFWVSLQKGVIGTAAVTYTWGNYAAIFGDPFIYRVFVNTAVFTLSTVFFALSIGLPIAWLTERTTIPGKVAIYTIMTLGLLIPGIYTAMGWTFIAHPRIGFLNRWLVDLFGLESAPLNIATPVGMGFVQGLSLSALAFILTAQVFRAMNPSLEEAAKVHGMGFLGTLYRVTLPLALPGILAAVIYMVTIGLATFDIPAIIGLGNRIYMLSTFVYIKAHPPDSGLPEYGITASLGTFMISVAVLLTFWYGRVLRQGHRFEVVTGKGYRPTLIKLGGWAFVGWGFILLYALLSKILPFLLLAYAAFTPYLAPPSWQMMGRLSLVNYYNMDWELIMRGLKNTVLLVAVVPVVVLLCSFCISWVVVRSRSRLRYVLDLGAFLPHALPEVIMAVGALLLGLFVVGDWLPLYGSVWLIAMVYVIARLAFATRAINSSLLQIHRELEEAAYAAGLSTVRASWRILVPLVRPTLLSVWIWTTLLVYRELTVAVFLASHRSITLPAVVWSFWFGGGRNEAAAVTLLMTVVVTPLILVFWWFGRRSVVPSH